MMLSMPGGFFSEPVGVPIYDFFFKGGQICRIIEWTWTIKNSDKMLNIFRPAGQDRDLLTTCTFVYDYKEDIALQ